MELCRRLFTKFVLAFALLSGGIAAAADSDPVPEAVGAAQPATGESDTPAIAPPVVEDKRVFGVLPNYRTAEEMAVYQPITSKQKMIIATKDTLDYPLFGLGGALAGIAQLTDEHPRFGQGFVGYMHRYGTSYADEAVGNYMTEGILPVLFHEDPRFFRRGHGPKLNRAVYAASRIFITKTDSGGTSFNFAEVLGNSVSAGLGNAYYPGERTLWDNASRLLQELGTDAASQVLKEFWPDIKKRYWVRHKSSASLLPPGLSSTAGQ